MPARRAQPVSSGPATAKIAIAIGAITAAVAAGARRPSGTPSAREIRTNVATVTAATQAAVSASIHHTFVSLPVPRPWRTAIGQLA